MGQGGAYPVYGVQSWILAHGSGGQAQSYMHLSREVYAGKYGAGNRVCGHHEIKIPLELSLQQGGAYLEQRQYECPNAWALVAKPKWNRVSGQGVQQGSWRGEWNHIGLRWTKPIHKQTQTKHLELEKSTSFEC